ncbi:MAG TPA: TRAP transporter substrate-binding protein DctP [Clostridia bacterium]|nr:TRAP transporter substrate-binding protein DctP [Clostridia bacterium]
MKMKRFFSLFLALVMLVSVTAGCAKGAEQSEDGQQVVELRVAGQDPEDHPNTIALRELKEKVEAGTEGRVKMTIYPANQLGDYTSMFEEVMKGSIDMALINVSGQYEPRLEMQYVPYMATDYEQVEKTFSRDSIVGEEYGSLLSDLGVKWLGFSMSGFVGVSTTKKLENPTEFAAEKGILLRVPGMEVWKTPMTEFGFRTVSVPYAELYTALQTGVADGAVGTSPLDTYSTVKDVIKYYYKYNAFVDAMSYIANKEKFDSLLPEDRELIISTVDELSKGSIKNAKKTDEEYLGKLEECGVEIIEFTQEELKSFEESTKEVTWPKLNDRLTKELMDKLKAGLQ